MADQRKITLRPGNATPSAIVLRNLPLADTVSTTIYLYPGHGTPQHIVLRNPLAVEAAGGAADYTDVGSGGITLAGDASQSFGLTTTPLGGVVFGGSASTAEASYFVNTPSGGIAFGGTAANAYGLATTPSGGIEFSGAASSTVTFAFSDTGSGGVEFSGSAAGEFGIGADVSGGISFSGAAATLEAFSYVDAASGGVAFGGTAPSEATYESEPEPIPVQSGGGLSGPIPRWDRPQVAHYRYRGFGRIRFSGRAESNWTLTHGTQAFGGIGFAVRSTGDWTKTYRSTNEAAEIRLSPRHQSAFALSRVAIEESQILELIL